MWQVQLLLYQISVLIIKLWVTTGSYFVNGSKINSTGGQKMSEINRAFLERRSGKDRRRVFSLHRFFYKGLERRAIQDRRSQEERRDGWVRINKWSSVNLHDLKISKYLH